MTRRNEHVIAIMLESVSPADKFIEWPLHITIVPWFHCDATEKLDKFLHNVADKQTRFSAKVGQSHMLGKNKDVPVSLIDESPKLAKLHQKILEILEKNGYRVHQKEWVGENYIAHITHQLHGRKHPGEKLKINSFTLVRQDRLKKTGTMVKTIVKSYELV